jgi:hypothetical protein
MTYQLIDIAVTDKHSHPRLPGRTVGHVRAVLTETLTEGEQAHELSIPVWTNTQESMSEADIDMALLLKAAEIVARVKARLDLTP